MNKNSGIILINPPLWYYQSVPVDLIYAAFQFNLYKIDIDVRDLNLEFLKFYFNKQNKDVFTCLNTDEFFDIQNLRTCYLEIEKIFQAITQSVSPSKIDINYFEIKEDIRRLSYLENIICNAAENPYIEFYESIMPSLLNQDTKFIAFSVYHPDQIVPLLTIAKIIKQYSNTIKIHLFGNLEDQINTKMLFKDMQHSTKIKLSKYIDSVSIGESHSHLVEIYKESVNSNVNEADVKIYMFEGKEIFDLDDITLKCLPKSNFMPKDILNITMSTGCYWNKCSYCSIHTHSIYRKSSVNSIIKMLKYVADSGLYSIVRFRDSCLHPHILSKIADEILDKNIKINWSCRVRFERGFNRELFLKLRDAGCLMLSFGIESFHPIVNKNMNKGVDVNKSVEILKECFKSDIAVKLTAIYEYPTETYEDTIYNLNKLKEVGEYCVDIKINKFILFNNSEIALKQEQYGIQKLPFDDEQDLRYFCDYIKKDEDDQYKKQDIQKRVENFNASFNKFISEEHLLLYLEKYGLKKCMGYIFDFPDTTNSFREVSHVT